MYNLLIDANNMAMKAWHSNKNMCNSDGIGTGVIFTMYRTIQKLVRDLPNISRVILCWDGGKELRKAMYLKNQNKFVKYDKDFKSNQKSYTKKIKQGYKGTRRTIDGIEDAFTQMNAAMEFFEAMGIRSIKVDGVEADDVIYHLAKRYKNSIISSGDSDFLQCVKPGISVNLQLVPQTMKKLKGTKYYEKEILLDTNNFSVLYEIISGLSNEKKAIPINRKSFLFYKACIGDTADNIPGILGVGEITLTKELKKYHCSFHKMLSDKENKVTEKILKYYDLFEFSCSVMSLPYAYKILKNQISEALPDNIDEPLNHDTDKLKELVSKYELNDFLKDFDKILNNFYKLR